MNNETNSIGEIRADVSRRNPGLKPGEEIYDAECLCLLLGSAAFDSWDAIQVGAPKVLGVGGDRIPQMIVNLRSGGALLENGFVPALQAELLGEDSGIVLSLLANVALGRMRYLQNTDSYLLTEVGKAFVENRLLASPAPEAKQ